MSISVEQVEEFANSPVQACLDYARAMRPPLSLEIAAARGVAALSRRLGTGGGTTIPGKLLAGLDRGAIDRLAARLAGGNPPASASKRKKTATGEGARRPPPRAPAAPKPARGRAAAGGAGR